MSLNTFWFQGVPFEGTNPGPPRTDILNAIAAVIAPLAPDLLCLQEIQSAQAFQTVKAAFDRLPFAEYAPGAVLPQYGLATLARWPLTPISSMPDLEPRPQRAFQVFRVKSLRVAHVHLPSGRQKGKEEAARLRLSELRQIREACDNIDLWLGDVNEPPGGPVSTFWQDNGFVDAALLTGHGHVPTAAAGSNRIDRIVVSRRLSANVTTYGVLSCSRFRGPDGLPLSDHLPLWIDITF